MVLRVARLTGPRLAEEFRSCRQGVCRRVRDSRPGWAEAVASGDVAHAVIEWMLETDWQGWFPSWPREPEDDDPAAARMVQERSCSRCARERCYR